MSASTACLTAAALAGRLAGAASRIARRGTGASIPLNYRCIPDLAEALTGHPEPVDVIATYTPFQRLRKMGRV
ncbi:MAG TPA: hypothetical protein VFO20_01960 [Propionibacteriaceae bacterium]|nr:hypothetical protein [Propionibacteriaceae bacterium]